jgi:hypothetical protein
VGKIVRVHVIRKAENVMLVNLIIMEIIVSHVQKTVGNLKILVIDLREGAIYVKMDFGVKNVNINVVNFFVKILVIKILEFVIHVN